MDLSGLRVTDWSAVVDKLLTVGAAQLTDALDTALCQRLTEARSRPWSPLPAEEGIVRQQGFGSFMPLDEADPDVVGLASAIVDGLSAFCPARAAPLPVFNEVTWTLYPQADGRISAHRDPDAVGGVIGIATLLGEATFRIWDAGESGWPHDVRSRNRPTEWTASAGGLILIRGNGWPAPSHLSPVHEALAPSTGERMIMTLRHNIRGPGAPYFD